MVKSLFIFLFLALTSVSYAQSEGQVYATGALEFEYDQLFGGFDGSFSVEGAMDSTTWMPADDQGVGGFLTAVDSTGAQTLLTVAAELDADADSTWNVFGLYHLSETPIEEGDVSNPTQSVFCFFIWHADSFVIPEELPDSLAGEDLIEMLLGAIVAEHKLVGVASSFSIESLNEEILSYQFSAMLVDPEDTSFIVTMSNGNAELDPVDTTDIDSSPVHPQTYALHCAPNPFNPSTTVRFELRTAGDAQFLVTDVLGREVERVNLGHLHVGHHVQTWHATNRATGVYTIQVLQNGRLVGHEQVTLIK